MGEQRDRRFPGGALQLTGFDGDTKRLLLRVVVSRRVPLALLFGTILSVAVAIWGQIEAPLPNVTGEGEGVVPAWRILALAIGILPTTLLQSPFAALEEVRTKRIHAFEIAVLACVVTSLWIIFLAFASFAVSTGVLVVMLRSLCGWLGLALLSGLLLGWRLVWVLPIGVFCICILFGVPSETGSYPWWDFSAAPSHQVFPAMVSGGLMTCGISLFGKGIAGRSLPRLLKLPR